MPHSDRPNVTMVFSSVIFLFFFFPLFLLIYFLMPQRMRNVLLLAASLLFYTWGEQTLVVIMLASTAVDYISGRVIYREFNTLPKDVSQTIRTPRQKVALLASICFNLILLGVFKYFNFAIDNYNALMSALGWDGLMANNIMEIVLPLGISFYTFQSLSYTIDCYRRQVKAARNLIDFACFVTMFPQLVAGPIVRYRDVEEHLVERTVTRGDFAAGIRQFVTGLGKKMLLANVVAQPTDLIFALPHDQITPVLAWAGGLFFTLQLYYDFAGYSDMAIGIGRMLGFRFPKNFNYPYISKNIAEFWQRWHITLSTWLRDYLFVSLGGYRVGRTRAYLNLVIVFTFCGLWHGASWNFILFGFNQGIFITLERILKANRRVFFTSWMGHFYCLSIVFSHMVIFRSDSLKTVKVFLAAMIGLHGAGDHAPHLGVFLDNEIIVVTFIGMLLSVPLVPWLNRHYLALIDSASSPRAATALAVTGQATVLMVLAGIFLLCAMKLAAGTYNPFIYFRF